MFDAMALRTSMTDLTALCAACAVALADRFCSNYVQNIAARPTANPSPLDISVILCFKARLMILLGEEAVIRRFKSNFILLHARIKFLSNILKCSDFSSQVAFETVYCFAHFSRATGREAIDAERQSVCRRPAS